MLRLRPTLHNVVHKRLIARAYTTPTPSAYSSRYVPTAQLLDVADTPHSDRDSGPKQPPASPSFYTTTSSYYDHISQVEAALSSSQRVLRAMQLLPLPDFARDMLPPPTAAWLEHKAMSEQFGVSLTTTRYRKIIDMLNQLHYYNRIAEAAECNQVSEAIKDVSVRFQSRRLNVSQSNTGAKKSQFDEYGRTYTVGRRKTSSARVWIIPTQRERMSTPARKFPAPQPADADEESSALAELFGEDTTTQPSEATSSNSITTGTIAPRFAVNPTTVLVNNIPLAEYFPITVDRERIIRPIKLAGVLGGYNVFCLVRGGGTSGQSGAIAHGIAKGIAIHEPTVAPVLKAAKLLRRDPRMVERKKTGLAKARKRYTWVKR